MEKIHCVLQGKRGNGVQACQTTQTGHRMSQITVKTVSPSRLSAKTWLPKTAPLGFPSFATGLDRTGQDNLVLVEEDNLVLVEENKTWEEALEHCRALSSPTSYDLVSIQPEDYDYVMKKLVEANAEEVGSNSVTHAWNVYMRFAFMLLVRMRTCSQHLTTEESNQSESKAKSIQDMCSAE